MKARSLYVHFPFCETKCHYCDFYSLGRERTREGDDRKFENALRAEAAHAADLLDSELETIFLGGGTPSMTPPDSMARALEPLWSKTRITSDTEWTMEANPSSIQLETMKAYRQLGVNRVSMGVQSLRPDHLEILGRVHSRDKALEALSAVFEAGFENVSVDLLCGVPGQSTEDIEKALSELTRFPITHLSCYLLTLPKHHKMFAQLPNEETQLEHLLFLDRKMKDLGFEHYEISNFAKHRKRARHNLNYWTGKSYLGLGPSAHSFDESVDGSGSKRWKNVSSLHKYAELTTAGNSAIEWTEALTPEQRHLEKWMLALRLNEGVPQDWFASPEQKARALVLEQQGLLEIHPNEPLRKRLTAKGFALSDQIIASLV